MSDSEGPGWATPAAGRPASPPPPPSGPMSSPIPPPPPAPAFGSTPPPPPPSVAPPFQYPGQVPPAPGGGYTPTPRPAGNGFAVAALVLGLIWICGLGSLLAIIFGIIALRQGKTRPITGGTRGMAIAGIVLGSLGVIATGAGVVAVVIGADEIIETSADELDDLEITSCRAGAGGTVVVLEVTNDSSGPSNYLIRIDVESRVGDGSELLTTSFDIVDPDETVEQTVRGTTELSEPECSVGWVQRFSAD